MDEAKFQVRTLRWSEVCAAADLHVVAFPGFFLSALGARFLRVFYGAHLTDPAAIALVAVDAGGSVIGVVVGTTAPDRFYARLVRKSFWRLLVAAIPACVAHPSALFRVARGLFYRGERGEAAVGALLSSICVDPQHRGTGAGRALLEGWLYAARGAGAEAAHLSTDADNNAATIAFYEKAGWERAAAYATPQGRRMYLMTRDLGGVPERKPRPRVLHVVAGDSFGGASRIIESIVVNLGRSYDVEVAVSEPRLAAVLEDAGLVVHREPAIGRRIEPFGDLRAVLKLRKLMVRGNYALVHTHTSKGGIVGRAAARTAGVPTIVHTIHNFAVSDVSSRFARLLNFGIERIAARFTSHLTVVSEHLLHQANDARISAAVPTVVIPNGIPDVEDWQNENPRSDRRGLPVVLYHGRLARGKGLEELLTACAALWGGGEHFELRVVGAGEYEQELRGMADELDVPQSIFQGFSYDIAGEIAAASVCVQPSHREGMSVALLEIMRGGRPFVASNIPANREVVGQPPVGLMFEVGDAADLANKLSFALQASVALPSQPAIRARYVERYSAGAMCEQYRKLYRDAGLVAPSNG